MTIAKLKAHAFTAAVIAVLLCSGTIAVLQLLPDSAGQLTAATTTNDLSNAAFVLRGKLQKPNGQPLAGAQVHVATIGGMVRLYYMTNWVPTNAQVSKTWTTSAADGTFVVGFATAPREGKAVAVVNHDAGYAVATADELAVNPNVTVQPWGRIEGVLRIGNSLASNQTVNIGIWGTSETYEWNLVSHGYSVNTDANGRFVFPRVAPGDVWLTRSVAVRPSDGRQSGHRYIKVAPGDQLVLQLGGTGRTLSGRIEWSSDEKLNFYGSMWARESHGMRSPRNWRAMSAEEKRLHVRSWRESPESEPFKEEVRNYEFPVQSNGTFRVEDVLPGSYRMQVRADAPLVKGQSPRLAAKAEIQIDVPDGSPSDEPLDVGVLVPTPVR